MPKTSNIPSYLVNAARLTNMITGIIFFEFDDCIKETYEKTESVKNIPNNIVSNPAIACNPNAGINPKNKDGRKYNFIFLSVKTLTINPETRIVIIPEKIVSILANNIVSNPSFTPKPTRIT